MPRARGYKLLLSSKFYKFELKITYVDDLKPVTDMWGKAKPEWVQTNEMLRMRVGRG